jgi:hypothetical protein
MKMDNRDSVAPSTSTTAARQGVTGHNVRYVLGFGLAGVVVAFLIVGTYMGMTLPVSAP